MIPYSSAVYIENPTVNTNRRLAQFTNSDYNVGPQQVQDQQSPGDLQYAFKYQVSDVQSATNFGHAERRDGDLTEGAYYVALPDGRMQKVFYSVTPNGGYKARVR